VVTNARVYYITRAAAGAPGARHSLRPLKRGTKNFTELGHMLSRDREGMSSRHCEERSDEAIHTFLVARWIASLTLAMTECAV
jgi:hypothetical protein